MTIKLVATCQLTLSLLSKSITATFVALAGTETKNLKKAKKETKATLSTTIWNVGGLREDR